MPPFLGRNKLISRHPLPTSLSVDPLVARRFAVSATGLATPVTTIGQVFDQIGFVQIDPLNVCGRMHEHILRHRVVDYAEGDLHEHLYGLPDDAPLDSPGLAGDQLIGDVDLKADRPANRLRVISRRIARGHPSTPAVKALARFLSLK